MLVDPKTFKENFIYNKNFLLEKRKLTNFRGEKIDCIQCLRLRLKQHPKQKDTLVIYLDKKKDVKKKYLGNNENTNILSDADWLCMIPTRDRVKVNNQLKFVAINLNIKDVMTAGDIKKIKKALQTGGFNVSFSPCANCGSLEDLAIIKEKIYCKSCREQLKETEK